MGRPRGSVCIVVVAGPGEVFISRTPSTPHGRNKRGVISDTRFNTAPRVCPCGPWARASFRRGASVCTGFEGSLDIYAHGMRVVSKIGLTVVRALGRAAAGRWADFGVELLLQQPLRPIVMDTPTTFHQWGEASLESGWDMSRSYMLSHG